MENEQKPYKACPDCNGNGIKIGPIDEASGKRQVRECPRCQGGGVLILQSVEEGQPYYRAPKL